LAKGSSFWQNYLADNKTLRSEQLDIAIGSAEKAQTYGYWRDQQLFQLPLTYLASIHSWTNSPGFPVRQPYFDRVIESRCLECHASYVSEVQVPSGPLQVMEKLDQSSLIYGIKTILW
jgi:hypothetical protein